jgi:methionyl-tRNA synthetase
LDLPDILPYGEPMSQAEPFYITTAIAYPNGRPHIGHAYEAIAADVIARFQRLMGRDVYFQTGTDVHGLKMVQAARDKGVTARELADEMSSYFKEMDDALNVSYDRFIQTSEPAHYEASIGIWKAMQANGDIYLGRYEGWYSVRDEAFYDEKELAEGKGGQKLSPQGTPVEWTVEESWFFRLSKYQQSLLELYEKHPEFLQPDTRRNEVMRFVEGGLSDLSISRSSFDWGVPVPDSPGHVMYVWVDALTNYLTGLGYPGDTPEMKRFWPADIHLIGKDIVRFHAVYWPAFLMSAGLELPKQVFGHGFLLNRGEKMSKSVGNVVDPLDMAKLYGVDPLRYFLMREVSFGQDGSYSHEAIVTRCNAELANSFGNLAQRVLSFISKNCEGRIQLVEKDDPLPEVDAEFTGDIEMHLGQFIIEMGELNIDRAINEWMKGVFAANAYVDSQAPWKLKKTDPARMVETLNILVGAILQLTIAIQPITPTAVRLLLDQFDIPEADRRYPIDENGNWRFSLSPIVALHRSGFQIEQPTPIFPRLELELES